MLIKRIITASILATLIALAVFLLPIEYFSLAIGLVVLVGAWEWTNLASVNSMLIRVGFLVALVLPMIGIHFWTQILELVAQLVDWPDIRDYSGALEWLVIPPVIFWIVMMILIRNAPTGVINIQLKTRYKLFIGWFVLISAWMFLSRLKSFYGPEMTMYFFILIWVADIVAYFSGKKWGVTKLAPEISPGKTVAGMYGALLSGLVSAICLNLYNLKYGFNPMIATDFILISVLTVLVSIYGDLFISVVKRQRGVKDSGSLLPGHGGVLDRIDSLLAAAPFFYGCIYFIYRLVE